VETAYQANLAARQKAEADRAAAEELAAKQAAESVELSKKNEEQYLSSGTKGTEDAFEQSKANDEKRRLLLQLPFDNWGFDASSGGEHDSNAASDEKGDAARDEKDVITSEDGGSSISKEQIYATIDAPIDEMKFEAEVADDRIVYEHCKEKKAFQLVLFDLLMSIIPGHGALMPT